MSVLPAADQKAPPVNETAEQRRIRLENEVDAAAARLYAGNAMSWLCFVLFVIGGLCLVGGAPPAIPFVVLIFAAVIFAMDVRRHVQARERAEQRVRSKR